MKIIRLNDWTDGVWIMEQIGGRFDPIVDRCMANTLDGQLVGGFVYQNYTGIGGSIMVHMAGANRHWCSRDLMWMVFDYAFVQLGVHKLVAPCPAASLSALTQELRAGFHYEARLENMFPDGSDLLLLSMTREQCRWLKLEPRNYRRNYEMSYG